MTRLIGLTGFAGAGKSTAARHLVERHGFYLVKMAGPLKDMLRALGLRESEIEGDLKEEPCVMLGGRTPRYAMQTLGTEWGREMIYSHLWVNAAMGRIHAILEHGGRVVVDDVRFPNEAIAIMDAGGRILAVERPGVGAVNAHASDNLAPANWTLRNSGPVEALGDMLDEYLSLFQEETAA